MLTAEMTDREFRPPRRLRASTAETIRGWDLFALSADGGPAAAWADEVLEDTLTAAQTAAADARGCTDCADTGFYGVADLNDPDLLVRLLKRRGENGYEVLLDTGEWVPYDPEPVDVEMIDVETAGDLASVVTAGGAGLLRRWVMPLMFLPPDCDRAVTAAGDLPTEGDDWAYYGILDEADTSAVLDVIRCSTAGVQRFVDGDWVDDTPDVDLPTTALDTVTAAALVADAPLTVSPDPRAEKLRRYWSTGRGAAKIKWGLPSDWRRCYRHLRKYMGLRAKGYCQNLHKRNNGFWTGDRRNRGLLSSLPEEPISPERQLVAAIQDGSWTQQEGTPAMSEDVLPDGIYCEASSDDAVLRTLLAGGFPVAPPDKWFADPKLDKATPMTVDDSGQVKGHIATWDSIHIGMAGAVRAPKSRSGYAYFTTGQIKTDTGNTVNIGQLTLAGGHASLQADAKSAVKHYDDTNSAVADVTVGEDRHGIWAAGALRPSVTPEQLRTFRASPLSGDWRPINGGLELVAACAVNVPGFPIARARVASGAVQALVAAGSRPLAMIAATNHAESAMIERLTRLEALVAGAPSSVLAKPDAEVAPEEPLIVEDPVPEVEGETAEVVVESDPVVEVETSPEPVAVAEEAPAVEEAEAPVVEEETETDEAAAIRAEVERLRRDILRDQVGNLVSAGLPPQFVKKGPPGAEKKAPTPPGKGERKGIGGYPINNEEDLKNAIQAFGRARPEDKEATKAHIISKAKELGLTDLIPEDWK